MCRYFFRLFLATLFSVSVLTLSATSLASISETQETETQVRTYNKHQEYITKRLDAVSKAAALTEEEKKFVGEELLKSDRSRFEFFKKSRELRQKMGTPTLSETEYAGLLTQFLDLEQERVNITKSFYKRLETKLSNEKRAKIYLELRKYNARFASRIRRAS